MPEHGDRISGEAIGRRKGCWYVELFCVDCGVGRYAQDKKPYAQRCQVCHRERHKHTLGLLTLPIEERKKFKYNR